MDYWSRLCHSISLFQNLGQCNAIQAGLDLLMVQLNLLSKYEDEEEGQLAGEEMILTVWPHPSPPTPTKDHTVYHHDEEGDHKNETLVDLLNQPDSPSG